MIHQKQMIILLVLYTFGITAQNASPKSLRPPIRLGYPTHMIDGQHISLEFYVALDSGDCAKTNLQFLLHNFLENLQSNLSTSSILNSLEAHARGIEKPQYQMKKLHDLADYFQHTSEAAGMFAQKAEQFFETSKNESYSLLLKLRQVPSAQRFLPTTIKMRLTDYFAEMEYFHIMFSEIIDQALEYNVDTVRSVQRTFIHYADIQRDILRTWNIKPNEWCFDTYMDFLQQWSAQIFKCSTSNNLKVAYDVYATTETSTKYIMRQLEFRIQRLYNCFVFGNYELRCAFLRKPEQDFEKLFAKLDELQQYYDVKAKHGRVTINRSSRRRRNQDNVFYSDKCIPRGFPNLQMIKSLKTCFYSPTSNT